MAWLTETDALLDSLPFGVALFSADGVCVRTNAAFDAILPEAGLAGRRVADVSASCCNDALSLAEGFRTVMADGGTVRRECCGADGRRYECAWQAGAAGGPAAVLAVTDVTAHREHQRSLEERVSLAAVLTGIETMLGYATDFDDILGVLVNEAPEGAGCASATALVHASGAWQVRHVRSLPRALVGERFETEDIPYAEEALTRRKLAHGRCPSTRWGEGELLVVPLPAGGEIPALLLLAGRSVPFSPATLEFADKLSTVASFALENARLHQAERETRDALQTALVGIVGEVPRVCFGHLYHSAAHHAQVGGDFYELFDLGDDRVGMIMGDVSGKGLPAASLAAVTKTTVKIHARELDAPAAVMARTNEVLVGECRGAAFVTAFYAVLDTSTGELRYCSAGHPPPVLRRTDGETMLLQVASPILGAYGGLAYEEHATVLANGDVLLLYTDGVTEARREGEQYGHERLQLLLGGLAGVNVRELPQLVFEDVFAHVRGDLGDDMAILAVTPTGVDEVRRQQQLDL